jgi:hypothetical protein
VPALPLLVLPAAELLERRPRSSRRGVAVASAAVAGILVSALAVLVPFERHAPPAAADPAATRDRLWRVAESPLVLAARDAPAALTRTLRLLSGRAPLPGPEEKGLPGLPDLAFARYGSHALLELTRGALGLALLAGGAVGYLVGRRRAVSTDAASQ